MIRRIKLPGWIVIILLLAGIIYGINQVVVKVLVESTEPNEPNEKIIENKRRQKKRTSIHYQ